MSKKPSSICSAQQRARDEADEEMSRCLTSLQESFDEEEELKSSDGEDIVDRVYKHLELDKGP